MSALHTLVANLKHAARNNETTHIGGGDFSPSEVRAALAEFNEILNALYHGHVYVEDVLANPRELACFKPGVVQGHSKQILHAINIMEGVVP